MFDIMLIMVPIVAVGFTVLFVLLPRYGPIILLG